MFNVSNYSICTSSNSNQITAIIIFYTSSIAEGSLFVPKVPNTINVCERKCVGVNRWMMCKNSIIIVVGSFWFRFNLLQMFTFFLSLCIFLLFLFFYTTVSFHSFYFHFVFFYKNVQCTIHYTLAVQ